MTYKKALILGGAILVVAGCSSSTAPIAQVDGGAASAALAPSTKKVAPSAATPMTAAEPAGQNCRGSWPVSSGFIDTTCVSDR